MPEKTRCEDFAALSTPLRQRRPRVAPPSRVLAERLRPFPERVVTADFLAQQRPQPFRPPPPRGRVRASSASLAARSASFAARSASFDSRYRLSVGRRRAPVRRGSQGCGRAVTTARSAPRMPRRAARTFRALATRPRWPGPDRARPRATREPSLRHDSNLQVRARTSASSFSKQRRQPSRLPARSSGARSWSARSAISVEHGVSARNCTVRTVG